MFMTKNIVLKFEDVLECCVNDIELFTVIYRYVDNLDLDDDLTQISINSRSINFYKLNLLKVNAEDLKNGLKNNVRVEKSLDEYCNCYSDYLDTIKKEVSLYLNFYGDEGLELLIFDCDSNKVLKSIDLGFNDDDSYHIMNDELFIECALYERIMNDENIAYDYKIVGNVKVLNK